MHGVALGCSSFGSHLVSSAGGIEITASQQSDWIRCLQTLGGVRLEGDMEEHEPIRQATLTGGSASSILQALRASDGAAAAVRPARSGFYHSAARELFALSSSIAWTWDDGMCQRLSVNVAMVLDFQIFSGVHIRPMGDTAFSFILPFPSLRAVWPSALPSIAQWRWAGGWGLRADGATRASQFEVRQHCL